MNQDVGRRLRVLVVEDEVDLQELLRFNLERDGYEVLIAGSGEQAVRLVTEEKPDLVLLDLMLPRMDGLDVCRRVKSDGNVSHIPIIIVTAKGEDADVVAGLELGADDYITKPFSPRILMARVRAVLRRQADVGAGPIDESEGVIKVAPIALDPDRHEATLEGKMLDLTATEFRLLKLLVRRPGRVFTRQQIIEAIHGGQSAVTDRSVDVQVVSLRRKLGKHADLVQTVRGVGYRFRE
jgi:DNA-binding response OmpR family regulator